MFFTCNNFFFSSSRFDRDDGKLTRKISKLLKAKFDDEYYCWSETPPDIQRRYFEDFAVLSS